MIRFDKILSRVVLGILFSSVFLSRVYASPILNSPIQVTSNPGEDFAPAVSADGKLMVYVSDKSGNLDLWLKHLGPGIQLPDQQLTFHSAEDGSPEISPDGKRVAFVSHRSDPRGDIYILDLATKESMPVIRKKGEERGPVWSLDQKHLFFSSRSSNNSTPVIEKIELDGSRRSEVLNPGGVNLSLSPDGKYLAFVTGETKSDLKVLNLETNTAQVLTQGPLIDLSPRWSIDGQRILFARYQNDTNHDGQLGIDDNPDIWSVEFKSGKAGRLRQLTASSSYDFLPRPLDEKYFLFTSHLKGSSDIWKLPLSGLMGSVKPENIVDEICSEWMASYSCVLVLNNSEKSSRTLFHLAKQYLGLGNEESARPILNQILTSQEDDRLYQGLAEIELLLLDLQDDPLNRHEGIDRLDKITASYSGIKRVEAKGLLELGKLSLVLEKPGKALEYFQKVIRQYSSERDISAEAAFSQNRIYASVGNREKLVDSLIQVMRDYPDVGYWKQKTMGAVLELYEDHPTLEKKVSSLQVLVETDLPLLSAMVQNRIGELYHQSAENLLAKEAFQKTIAKGVEDEAFKARFALARIYAEEENFEQSLSIYREISNNSRALSPYVETARKGLINKTLEKGDWELRVGEVKLARKTFLKLLEEYPETVKAHRGYLQASAALGKNEVGFYRNRLKTRRGSAVEHYALGLALTYLNPPALDEAELEIGKALAQNSQEVYYHQTLGWIYEQKERSGKGFLEKALHEYQIALALNANDSRNEADLLLNLGNGNYLLNNPLSAFHYYKKREQSGVSFLDSDREAVYRQRFGSAAFKLDNAEVAVAQLKKSLKIYQKKDALSRMAELHDRIGLAYQDHGNYALAVEHFTKTLELNRQMGNEKSISRTLRNIANNIYSGNQKERDSEKMARALNHYFQAVEKLDKLGAESRKKKSSALIDVNIEAGIGEDISSAAYGFDKVGEEKLIFHYIGKIYGDFGQYKKAIEYFNKKLALIPSGLEVESNIPVLLEKALLLNQIGNYYFQSSEYESSRSFFEKSFDLSRKLNNRRGMMVNAINIGRIILALSSSRPLQSLKGDIFKSIEILEVSAKAVDESSSDSESLMVLHNYLGILRHMEGFHLISEEQTSKSKNLNDIFKANLIGLNKQWQSIQKSMRNFEIALDYGEKAGKGNQAVWQNLQWTRYLAGIKTDRQNVSLKDRWQSVYSRAGKADGPERLALLIEAEQELSRLPYGWLDRSQLALVEQLYDDLVSILFEQEEYSKALMFSEKGKMQVLQALAPPLKFTNEDRQAYYDEIVAYSSQLKSISEEDVDALLDEYREFLELASEDDPDLVGWVSPKVPSLESLQLALQNTLLLKLKRVHNEILVWWVRSGKIRGKKIIGERKLLDLISSDGEVTEERIESLSNLLLSPLTGELGEGLTSIVLIADGRLEFLPWAAMKLEGKPLIETSALTFVSSLSQWQRSIKLKNLYNSRLLVLGDQLHENSESGFSTVLSLHGEQADRKNFLKNWGNFGVVQIDSPVHVNRLDPDSSYLTLTRQPNKFQRVPLSALYQNPFESNLMMLADIEHEFDPFLSLSATSMLVEGVTFKGFPGVLLHSGRPGEKIHDELMGHMLKNLRTGNPAEVLRNGQRQLAKKYPDDFGWAQYRYFGFQGMSDEEKNAFAQNHFQANLVKGASAYKEKNWLVAIDHLEKALVLQPFLSEKKSAGNIYKTLAQAAYNSKDYSKAILYQKQVLPHSEDDPEILAEALYFLGILYSRVENFSLSVKHLKEALKIFEEYEILDRLAENYSTLGIVEENALDYDNALKAFNASLAINEEIGEDLNRGRELRRIGRIYYLRLNRFNDARKYFNRAYELFAELGQVDQQVESLLELGLVAEKEADFEQALKLYGRAQSMAEEAGLMPALAKSFLYQANSHWFQGNYQQAFRFQRQSLEIARKQGDKLQQAFILNTLGLIHWTLNDPKRALENLSQSLKLAEVSHSVLDVATAYNNIGLVHRKEKRYPESIEFFKKALKRDEQLKSKWGQGYTHRNMGMSLLRMGQLETAEEHLIRAVKLSRDIGNRTNMVKALLELGNLALERKQWDLAISSFRKTYELSEDINIKEVSWRALRGEGFAFIQLGKNEQAVESYKKAVSLVDALRSAIKVEEFQNGFLTDKQDVYKELVLLLLNTGKIEESFQYAERAKSRSFIDLLGNQKISLKDDISRKLYETLKLQKQKIRKTEESLAVARSSSSEEDIKQLAEELVKARNGYQDLLINAKEQSPEISSFVTVDAISLKRLQALLEDSVALIEYLLTKNELVAWVVTKNSIEVARVPYEENKLNGLIADYRERIQKLAPIEEQSKRLHSILIKPLEAFIKGKRTLGVVPHGHLHYISFSSLRDEKGYLIEKYPLFYSPSASVMQYTFKESAKRSGDIKVLALGNPDLGDFNYDLPLAEMEANAIKWDFPTVDIFTREKATESWLHEHISEYQVIHIASHGEFDPINPLFSSLKLARSATDDGNFEVNEVFGLDIKADIVTLSACQTGLGDIVGGDELVGLNRAFIYAGTHSILSSLWRVSDISTAVLIKHFYRNYGKENKAESLRKAQLLTKRLYPHPSYWAGFNLTGDYR